ncbi:hypothetical protein PM082_019940 [Marasmius tenuissimus]|nr:hypothetical protein PM082_019940 [Marasmius tenuissimus]
MLSTTCCWFESVDPVTDSASNTQQHQVRIIVESELLYLASIVLGMFWLHPSHGHPQSRASQVVSVVVVLMSVCTLLASASQGRFISPY